MPITKEQALEIAQYYILYVDEKFALKNNISVSESKEGWAIRAITTPVMLGQQTETMDFTIDANTGEVGVCISAIRDTVQDSLKKIREKEGLDKQKREELETKVKEFEKETKKKSINKKKMVGLRTWFKNNASWLKDIIELISTILSKLP